MQTTGMGRRPTGFAHAERCVAATSISWTSSPSGGTRLIRDGRRSSSRTTVQMRLRPVSAEGVVTVVPITSNVQRIYPFQVLFPAATCGLERDSKAQAEQVRSVALGRLGRQVGSLPSPLMQRLDEALRLHLDL